MMLVRDDIAMTKDIHPLSEMAVLGAIVSRMFSRFPWASGNRALALRKEVVLIELSSPS